MSTRFDQKGGFADQAAIRRKRRDKTADKIDKIIDWHPIEEYLEQNLDRRQNAVGNPAYPALGMFKALLLQSWYGLSDRELSDNLEDRISFSHFCGFSLDHEVPDNSTICRFRNHLNEKGLAEPLLEMINAQITAGGLEIKTGIIVDASIVESCRRPRKTQDVIPVDDDHSDSSSAGGGHEVKTSYSGDAEAAWTVKAKKPYYGYKAHIAVDAEHGFILAGHATPANRADCKEMMSVVKKCGLKRTLRSLPTRAITARNTEDSLKRRDTSTGLCTRRPGAIRFQNQSAWSIEPSAVFGARWNGPSAP